MIYLKKGYDFPAPPANTITSEVCLLDSENYARNFVLNSAYVFLSYI